MNIVKELPIDQISVLGTPAFLKSFSGVVDYGYLCEENISLAFCIRKKFGIWKTAQMPSPLYGSGVDKMSGEQKKDFLDRAVRCICEHYDVDEIININTSPFDEYPTGALYCKFGSYVIDLNQSEEELFAGLHSKHRNVVRKAEKDGLVVDCGKQYVDDCVKLMNETYSRQNKVTNESHHLHELVEIGEHVDFWVVKSGEEIQGCAILLWDNYSSYYLHGGSTLHTHSGAMNLLQWKAILKMKERGVHYYDFVGARLSPDPGSKLEGIQRFKSRFGGPMKVGYLWRYDIHPIKMNIYRQLMRLYMRMHGDKSNTDIIKEERAKGNY